MFDGEIPIYHLYYANRIGDLSTILTSFPYRQAGWMGRRGTNQCGRSGSPSPPRRSATGRTGCARAASPTRRPSASAPSAWTSRIPAAYQAAAKDWIVGLGYTDVSDVKDRGYFHSVYLRTPGGALFELAYSRPEGFTLDEPEDELGTHMCIPPHWEDRRSEIDQLEPIDTVEQVV